MIRAGDAIILCLALALMMATAVHVYTDGRVHAVRIASGTAPHRDHPAWRDETIAVHGPLGITTIEINDGRVRVVDSPCTQKLCLRAGWIDAAGDAIACVPNRVSIALLGDDPRFDAINF